MTWLLYVLWIPSELTQYDRRCRSNNQIWCLYEWKGIFHNLIFLPQIEICNYGKSRSCMEIKYPIKKYHHTKYEMAVITTQGMNQL